MTDPEAELLGQLRRVYLEESGERLAELSRDIASLRSGAPDAVASLRARFHRLAGSGGSYGFPGVSAIAREMEIWLASGPGDPLSTMGARLDDAVRRLAGEFGVGRSGSNDR